VTPRRIAENRVLASQKTLRASPQGQHDENANGDVVGSEHRILPRRLRPDMCYFGPTTILSLYRIAHSESTVDKWDSSPSAKL
jgi:hypothetical protein